MRSTLFVLLAVGAAGAISSWCRPVWEVVAAPVLSRHAPAEVEAALCRDYCNALQREGISTLFWRHGTAGQELVIAFLGHSGLHRIAIPVDPALLGEGQILLADDLLQLQTIEQIPSDYAGTRETYLSENAGRLIGLALNALAEPDYAIATNQGNAP